MTTQTATIRATSADIKIERERERCREKHQCENRKTKTARKTETGTIPYRIRSDGRDENE